MPWDCNLLCRQHCSRMNALTVVVNGELGKGSHAALANATGWHCVTVIYQLHDSRLPLRNLLVSEHDLSRFSSLLPHGKSRHQCHAVNEWLDLPLLDSRYFHYCTKSAPCVNVTLSVSYANQQSMPQHAVLMYHISHASWDERPLQQTAEQMDRETVKKKQKKVLLCPLSLDLIYLF